MVTPIVLFIVGALWFILFELARLGRRFEKSLALMFLIRYGGLIPLVIAVAIACARAAQISAESHP